MLKPATSDMQATEQLGFPVRSSELSGTGI